MPTTIRLRSHYWSNNHGAGRITVYGPSHRHTAAYDHASNDAHRAAVVEYCERYRASDDRAFTVDEIDRERRGSYPTDRYWNVSANAF